MLDQVVHIVTRVLNGFPFKYILNKSMKFHNTYISDFWVMSQDLSNLNPFR
jgi:hypothetical protein